MIRARNLVAIAALAAVAVTASAQQQAILKASNKFVGRASWSAGRNGENFRANGVVTAEYIVHPAQTARHEFTKRPGDFGNGTYAPISDWTDTFTDIHGTQADVSHSVEGAIRTTILDAWFSVRDECSATITPGPAPHLPVSVRVRGRDPWPIGLATDGALFEPCPEGMDDFFSLWAGTQFALDPDPSVPGSATARFGSRVAPGVAYDPDAFWDNGQDAIDLYRATITMDPSLDVHVDLDFGASTSLFTLDYRMGDGTPFNPLDPTQVRAIELGIESAFVGGVLMTDLLDIFSVGFTPSSSLTSFTVGQSSEAEASGLEVPSPGSLLIVSGALWCVASARRRSSQVE